MPAPNPNIIKAPLEIRTFWTNQIQRGDSAKLQEKLSVQAATVSAMIRTGRATLKQIEDITEYFLTRPVEDPLLESLKKKIAEFDKKVTH